MATSLKTYRLWYTIMDCGNHDTEAGTYWGDRTNMGILASDDEDAKQFVKEFTQSETGMFCPIHDCEGRARLDSLELNAERKIELPRGQGT